MPAAPVCARKQPDALLTGVIPIHKLVQGQTRPCTWRNTPDATRWSPWGWPKVRKAAIESNGDLLYTECSENKPSQAQPCNADNILMEIPMNEETFNLSIRKFLKMVGINSQREIERAVAKALEDGLIDGSESFPAVVTLEIPGLNLNMEFDGEIKLE